MYGRGNQQNAITQSKRKDKMQVLMKTQTARYARTEDLQLLGCRNDKIRDHSTDPTPLADLDYGLIKSLCKLGVSRERICSALAISYEDFDYLRRLAMI